jgi:hypothetical protein
MHITVRCALIGLAVISCVAAKAQAATGMAAMQYYVGTWSCLTGSVGRTTYKTVEIYTIESGIMREVYLTPVQGSMKKPYALNLLTAYDSKNERYVAAYLDDGGDWTIADITLNGNVEQWAYRFDNTGKITGRGTVIRSDHNHFTFTSYPTLAATKPDFKEVCERS